VKALAAIVAGVVGVTAWVTATTARAVRRYEAEIADARATAIVREAERYLRVEDSKRRHPSNRGKS
jgi:hypothetical protein